MTLKKSIAKNNKFAFNLDMVEREKKEDNVINNSNSSSKSSLELNILIEEFEDHIN
jgi:hypothetical protein